MLEGGIEEKSKIYCLYLENLSIYRNYNIMFIVF